MSDPVTPAQDPARPRPAPAPAVLGSHGAVFQIPHTPYGIRNSEIQIRKPPSPEHGAGSREDGAVQDILSLPHTFPIDS
jgi:hypothetical protein